MSELSVFSFSEKLPVRVSNINGEPWFVARDVATCLDYTPSSIASPTKLFGAVPDQWKGMQEFETRGGKQKLLALSEQGLYFFLGRSDKPKALPFQMWLAGEVIPQIRKTGRYECKPETEYLTEEHAYQLMAAVARRAKSVGAHYQTIYRALKDHFRIPRYTCLQKKDFEAALAFIQTVPVKTRAEWLKHEEEEIKRIEAATYKDEAIPPKYYTVKAHFMEELRSLVYTWRYLHRANLERYVDFLRSVDSPYAASMWEAVHDFNWPLLEASLDKIGYRVKELPCYKNWLSHQAA